MPASRQERSAAAQSEETRVNGRKIVGFLLLAFVVFYIFNSPADAAHVVKNIQHLLARLFDSLTKFVDSFQS